MNKSDSIPDWDLLIIDEAHYTTFFAFVETLLNDPTNQEKAVIGLTATPSRLGKRSLAEHYTILVKGPTPETLTKQGFLVPARYWGYKSLDLTSVGINRSNGDFEERELAKLLNQQKLNHQLALEFQRIGNQRRAIIFGVNLAHVTNMSEAFQKLGIPCAVIHGGHPTDYRQTVDKALRENTIQVVFSVGTLTEGYDNPFIEFVGLARPTLSLALYHQMVGRGLRPCPEIEKIDCIVYDFGTGNLERFGRVTDPINWNLETPDITPTPVVFCPACNNAVTPWTRVCPECKEVLIEIPEAAPTEIEPVPSELAQEKLNELEAEQKNYYRSQLRKAFERGYKPGYAAMKFKDKYGIYPASWWSEGALFGDNPTPQQYQGYLRHLTELAKAHNLEQTWIDHAMSLEFGQTRLDEVTKLIEINV
jgi:superfamily II DNA or RNA helicase